MIQLFIRRNICETNLLSRQFIDLEWHSIKETISTVDHYRIGLASRWRWDRLKCCVHQSCPYRFILSLMTALLYWRNRLSRRVMYPMNGTPTSPYNCHICIRVKRQVGTSSRPSVREAVGNTPTAILMNNILWWLANECSYGGAVRYFTHRHTRESTHRAHQTNRAHSELWSMLHHASGLQRSNRVHWYHTVRRVNKFSVVKSR